MSIEGMQDPWTKSSHSCYKGSVEASFTPVSLAVSEPVIKGFCVVSTVLQAGCVELWSAPELDEKEINI